MLETARTYLSASPRAKVQLWRSSLRRDVGTLSRDTRLLAGFRLRARRGGLGGFGFYCDRCHYAFSFFRGDYRGHDIDRSGAPELQANCDGKSDLKRRAGDMGSARAARPAQLLPENAV